MIASPTGAGRRRWIDQARGIAALFIVIQHAGSFANGLFVVPEWLETLRLSMAPFRLPLMMLLAGLLLDQSLRKGARPFIQSKLRQILWPFLVWTVISLVLA